MSIEFKNVVKKFGPKTVLDHVSFSIKAGEILFIMGKSGTGKSVTLKQIVGLMKPTSGQIFVDSVNVPSLSEDELPAIRFKCGMVFQHPALFDSLTIFDNISFGLKTPQFMATRRLSEKEIEDRVLEKIKLVHLSPAVLRKYPREISYGMQKRASLARTLAANPSYLLFDEPTTGLDPITTQAINDLIFDLSRQLKVTSVVVSHDIQCALKIADRILILDQGKVLFTGTPAEIKNSDLPFIRDFMVEASQVWHTGGTI